MSRRQTPGERRPALQVAAHASAPVGDPSCVSASSALSDPRARLLAVIRRAGWVSFVFFLAKGLTYLAASYVFFLMATSH
jgi:hypothetical protein